MKNETQQQLIKKNSSNGSLNQLEDVSPIIWKIFNIHKITKNLYNNAGKTVRLVKKQ